MQRPRMILLGGGALVVLGGVAAWRRSRRAGGAGPAADAGLFRLPSFATREKATNAQAGADGFVAADPAALARQAGVDPETYTLARFVASEFSSGSVLERAVIAWAILNESRRRGWPLLRMATTVCWREAGGGARCEDSGRYGKQFMGGAVVGGVARSRANRYAATSRDPTKADLHIATMVLAGRWPDPTGGATKFLDPSAFGAQTGTRRLNEVVGEWLARNEEVRVAGVREGKLRLFRPRAA